LLETRRVIIMLISIIYLLINIIIIIIHEMSLVHWCRVSQLETRRKSSSDQNVYYTTKAQDILKLNHDIFFFNRI
jgi:hypothetical protein